MKRTLYVVAAAMLTLVSATHGGAGVVRDGSTQLRAIINAQPVATHWKWEYSYLDEHFPGRKPIDHRFPADSATQRVYSVFTFMWRGQKRTIWFDITQPFREWAASTREFREFAKPRPDQ